ncbi:MAG: prepilin-type N-terminal cleavage/methylation domain-containing protein [Colwellia polaris]|jgi:MSHA pilin protein MshA|uniref:type II secretion system protein n=1 Tax=Colwellia polaris TaxID=326537 RepID=UPI000A16CD09|nr:prepilin-type N-terminal cleavage/methylation domain-containing protein [Colwellia polaris]|tara:strand:- start:22486 stop:22974 length:489 start_codon:yes stop_codon:yes gene_type:complete
MNSKGFTLIELIVVIVILGILAATAAPKFINLKAEAQTSTLEGVKATMQGAAALLHTKSLVKGNQKQPTGTINIGDGGGFSNNGEIFVRYGYPFAKLSDWQRLIKLDDNFSYLVVNSTSENTLIIYRSENAQPTSFDDPCMLYYQVASDENSLPTFTLNECV